MADEKPSLHIDTDWKKQAQEEKRRLAEEEQRRASAAPPPAPAAPSAGMGSGPAAPASAGSRGQREMPPPSFPGLVQSMVTQVLFYLGDIAPRGGQPMLDLDLAKHHIDTLGVLEEKTRGNLTDEEKRMLDAAIYEVRMRYVSVASQYIG